MTRLHHYKNKIAISLLLCLLALGSLKAQEQDKTKEWKSYIQQLPSRQKYFPKESSRTKSLDLSDSTNTQLLKPSALVRYVLSKDYKSNEQAELFNSILSLPLSYQYIPANEIIKAKQDLSLETYFEKSAYNWSSSSKTMPKGIREQFEKWKLEEALYTSTMSKLQQENFNLFTCLPVKISDRDMGIKLLDEKSKIPHLKEQNIDNNAMHSIVQGLPITKVEHKHWLPSFESSIQLSQNYVSDNWYKGGRSNLNLHTRNYFKLEYRSTDGKIAWTNEIEDKLGLYSSHEEKSGQDYQISDDQLRLRSNFGLKASGRWYYTVDTEFKTQLFNTYNNKNNQEVLQSAFFAPFHFNAGLGMKYSYKKAGRVYGSKLSFSTNIAPLSFTYKKSFRDDIELGRHGLSPDKMSDYSIGSTLKAQINWQFNMDISWTSRLYFNTSYSHVETEWENTLNMKIGRYFSTRINLHLRYDDSIKPSSDWKRYLQVNELLSFGFNYRL